MSRIIVTSSVIYSINGRTLLRKRGEATVTLLDFYTQDHNGLEIHSSYQSQGTYYPNLKTPLISLIEMTLVIRQKARIAQSLMKIVSNSSAGLILC